VLISAVASTYRCNWRLLVVSDGAGLFCGVLKHLLDRGTNCPKVLAATHFHDIFRTDLFDFESVPVTFLHMQVMFTTIDGNLSAASAIQNGVEQPNNKSQFDEDEESKIMGPGETITYLYRCAPEAPTHVFMRLMTEFRPKSCRRPFAQLARCQMCGDIWYTTARS
jgi:hypothetical protein